MFFLCSCIWFLFEEKGGPQQTTFEQPSKGLCFLLLKKPRFKKRVVRESRLPWFVIQLQNFDIHNMAKWHGKQNTFHTCSNTCSIFNTRLPPEAFISLFYCHLPLRAYHTYTRYNIWYVLYIYITVFEVPLLSARNLVKLLPLSPTSTGKVMFLLTPDKLWPKSHLARL